MAKAQALEIMSPKDTIKTEAKIAKEKFVFLSINTTGCRPTLDKIFEIALYYWSQEGQLIKWHRLINPQIEIPSSIQQLAEVSPELMQQTHTFDQVAVELLSLVKSKIIVAANAHFKCSFLKQAMKENGYKWPNRYLCWSKFLSELDNAELKLPASINQSIGETYYAADNAKQLAENFTLLLQQLPVDFVGATINKLLKKTSIPLYLTAEMINDIPKTPGVYKFYGADNTLLYIGKSVCLQERIKSHFTTASLDNKEMRIAQQIKHIDWIETAGELGALLQEAKLVKKLMPIYNRKLRRYKGLFTLALEVVPGSYHRLQVAPCQVSEQPELNLVYGMFRQKIKAEQLLRRLVKEHGFCAKLTGLEKGKGPCFFYQIKICKGACIGKENVEVYNLRLQQVLMSMLYKTWPYPNAIAIKEVCSKTRREEYHIINQWCYVETVQQISDVAQLPTNEGLFDLDIYHILQAYMGQAEKSSIVPF